MFTLRFAYPVELLMAFPQIEKQTERHQPDFIHSQMKLADTEIQKPGKQFLVCYPTDAFFEGSSSLSILRLVPLSRASVIATL